MKLKLILYASLLASSEVFAGLHGLTIHSRANCGGFNESISWHATGKYWLETISLHASPNPSLSHKYSSNKAFTWRSASCHFAEAWAGNGWLVYGQHWISSNGRNWEILGYTEAQDCSLYDGWWG